MKYCSHCGQQIDENSQFCPGCGNAQTPASQPVTSNGIHLHCPKCKGTRFSPVVETDVKSGFSVHTAATKNLSFSNTQLKSIHRDYWMCQTCGTKFRNIENLEAEIATVSKSMKLTMIFCILFTVLSILCPIAEVGLACILSVPFAILLGGFHLHYRIQCKKLTEEKEYLSTNCFN
ncbi:MAG: zinc ribbon domain-containing protein [Oscillospiraceae bacterium]|nr:zinc ribbon domain-containing protein [Oscillospiraceae bacterium]